MDAPGRFEDFVVHEAAHIFPNGKRETFAYACEAYSRLHALGHGLREKQRLLAEHGQGSMPPDERVDAVEYVDILREAVAAGNGWKRILQRCSPPRDARGRRQHDAIGQGRAVPSSTSGECRTMTNRITNLEMLRKELRGMSRGNLLIIAERAIELALTLSGIDPLLLTKPDPPSRHGC
ncbi:MAG: hypothetical protein IAE88_12685, partial [Rhodobacteraceae bacterium]|nr:hypothetical protein [Paracoccaceae bacterium]